jgi:hypothetical protein
MFEGIEDSSDDDDNFEDKDEEGPIEVEGKEVGRIEGGAGKVDTGTGKEGDATADEAKGEDRIVV